MKTITIAFSTLWILLTIFGCEKEITKNSPPPYFLVGEWTLEYPQSPYVVPDDRGGWSISFVITDTLNREELFIDMKTSYVSTQYVRWCSSIVPALNNPHVFSYCFEDSTIHMAWQLNNLQRLTFDGKYNPEKDVFEGLTHYSETGTALWRNWGETFIIRGYVECDTINK